MTLQKSRFFKSKIETVVLYFIIFVILSMAVVPIYWMVSTSLKPPRDVLGIPPVWFSFSPSLENYRAVFAQFGFGPLRSTMIVTIGAVTVAMVCGCPAAYSLARERTVSTRIIGAGIWATRFLPTVAFMLPLFLMFSRIGLTGSHLGLILAYQIVLLPIAMYTMWSFFLSVPLEIEEAARLDGLGAVGVLFRITIPIVSHGLLATLLICVIFAWNQFFIGLILGGRDARVATVVLQQFRSTESAPATWGGLYAWTTIIALPVLIFGLLMSSVLIRVLTGSKEGVGE